MNHIVYRSPFRMSTALLPFRRPMSLLDDIDGLARDFWTSWRPGLYGTASIPHTYMYEEKGVLVIKTELPGISEKDLEITLEGDMLTVKAERKEEVTEDVTHHTRERYLGRYFRSMSLPYHVNADKVSATFENGVLELRLPKAEETEAKRIEVKTKLPTGERKKRQQKSG